jgi:tetratricopeptide (TPR) repeat protein
MTAKIWARRGLPALIAALAAVPGGAQRGGGIPTETTRVLNNVTEMGHNSKTEQMPRSLTFEDSDDPTIAKHSATAHEPPRAARKAAEGGDHLAKKGQHAEAAAKYREALSIDPLYYEAANNLALELSATGNTAEAESVFRGLMKSAPEHVLAFTNLATVLCTAHRYAEAEAVARQAMQLHSFSFKANLMLGTAMVEQGHWTPEARTKLEYAEAKYPDAKALIDKWPATPAKN